MKFSLNIDYPVEQMAQNRRRMEARQSYQYADRVPVGFCLVPRYFTPIFEIPYREIFKDVETQYYWQLQFAKYRIENVPEDAYCCSPTVVVAPYFDNVIEADAFGAEIFYPENETLFSRPTIKTVEEMERFQVPEPDAGLWGTVCEWRARMEELAGETRLTFNGKEGRVTVGQLGISGIGPHMIAIDLVGENFYAWMLECPERCHVFMQKITHGLIQAQRRFEEIDPGPRTSFGLAEDSAQVISPELFKEFVVPYDNMLYDAMNTNSADGRGMHMCGQSTHLHQALVNDLRITSFNLFGYQVPPEVAAKNLGGKALLTGNIDPMLMHGGTKAEVRTAACEALDSLAPCGGFMLADGANVCPGTPLENLAELTAAAQQKADELFQVCNDPCDCR
jgi:uroporphyrinogen decarboxylase